MLVPLLVAFYYREPLVPFIVSFFITLISALLLMRFKGREDWQQKEALSIVALSWLAAAIFGAIPFLFERVSFIDAVFEAMSGFYFNGFFNSYKYRELFKKPSFLAVFHCLAWRHGNYCTFHSSSTKARSCRPSVVQG